MFFHPRNKRPNGAHPFHVGSQPDPPCLIPRYPDLAPKESSFSTFFYWQNLDGGEPMLLCKCRMTSQLLWFAVEKVIRSKNIYLMQILRALWCLCVVGQRCLKGIGHQIDFYFWWHVCTLYRGRILGRNWDKSLKFFLLEIPMSPLLTDFNPPLLNKNIFQVFLAFNAKWVW